MFLLFFFFTVLFPILPLSVFVLCRSQKTPTQGSFTGAGGGSTAASFDLASLFDA
jgi:hypothetical protein